MNIQNHLIDAVDVVLAWDIPEEAFSDAVNFQACLFAKGNPEELFGFYLE